jgi:hypothetical protein
VDATAKIIDEEEEGTLFVICKHIWHYEFIMLQLLSLMRLMFIQISIIYGNITLQIC